MRHVEGFVASCGQILLAADKRLSHLDSAQHLTDGVRANEAAECGRGEGAASLLTIAEVAIRLGVKPGYVYRMVAAGAVPYVKIGRLVRFEAADIEKWIIANRVDQAERSYR